jgi:hypothetical protein
MTDQPDTQKYVRPAAWVGKQSTTELEVRLLGGFELRNRAGESLRLRKRKAEALLAVLALQPGQSLSRAKLCALLWPDVSDAQARHSLRQTLLYLRKVLPKHRTILHSNLRAVQLSAAHVSVDVTVLERAVAIGTRESYIDAAQLNRGDLLEGSVGPRARFRTLAEAGARTCAGTVRSSALVVGSARDDCRAFVRCHPSLFAPAAGRSTA